MTPFRFILFAFLFMISCQSHQDQEFPEGMVLIPSGEFIMGSNKVDAEGIAEQIGMIRPLYQDEHPERRLFLPDFYIDRFEVTNLQHRVWIRQSGHPSPPHWGPAGVPAVRENHPVTYVSWHDAQAYCRWRGGRLPTEAEWEKAARGPHGLEYPWGDQFDAGRANTGDSEINDTVPVGTFKNGGSFYGIYDLIGNAGEWVADDYKPYPGNEMSGPLFEKRLKVIRGGSWGGGGGHYALGLFYRTAHRLFGEPNAAYPDIGFRCARGG